MEKDHHNTMKGNKMQDGKDKALMKAAALAGFMLSSEENLIQNQENWNKRGCELAEGLLREINTIYSPAYLMSENGEITQVK